MYGEKPELKEEVVTLAKRYGITTPYTSWLIVPDGAVPVAAPGRRGRVPDVRLNAETLSKPTTALPPALTAPGRNAPPVTVEFYARTASTSSGGFSTSRVDYEQKRYADAPKVEKGGDKDETKNLKEAEATLKNQFQALDAFDKRRQEEVQTGKLGVDLSLQTDGLRNQSQLTNTANRFVQGRNVIELGGVWIDEGFTPKTNSVTVKAQSAAYFRILEKQPQVKDVFRLGNHLVWVTPSGTALVIDTRDGKDKLDDETIDNLFKVKK